MSFTLWFMGRPAAGKSTLAKQTEQELRDRGYSLENLDGDEIRKQLHPDLGFSREDRATNNRRTAFICKLLNRNGIPVVNAMITPFRDSQREARDIIEPDGDFVLIHVKCSVDEAKRRDPKGLYEQAEAGNLEKFTGINHPFQVPHNPDVVVDTDAMSENECVKHVLARLGELGVFDTETSVDYNFDISQQEESEIVDRLTSLGYLESEDSE